MQHRCFFAIFAIFAVQSFHWGLTVPAQTEIVRLRGILALADKGENLLALQQARAFLQSAPHSAEALDLAGVLATRQGLLSEAHDYLLRAARIRPDSTRILSNLGYLLIQRNSRSEAVRFLRGALLLDPDSSDVADNFRRAVELFNQPENNSLCTALIQQAKSEKSKDRIVVFSDFSSPCDVEGPQWLNSEFPAILKFRGRSKLTLQFEPAAADAWVFWNFQSADLPGSERVGSAFSLVIPLPGPSPLLLTASRPILLKAWRLE